MKVSILSVTCFLALAGCSSSGIQVEAEDVTVIPSDFNLKKCTLIKEIEGSYSSNLNNNLNSEYTRSKTLMNGARNALRNEAFKNGANSVMITETLKLGEDENSNFDHLVLIGNAFKCR